VRAHLEPSHAELSTFAVRAGDGSLRICLINKDADRRARVKVNPNKNVANATILRLAGPRLDSTTDVTLGGATVDENGSWTPGLDEARDVDGSEVVFEVAASSAAVITLSFQREEARPTSGLKSEFRDVQ
jgi:hypothetical protein